MIKQSRPLQIDNLHAKIIKCIENQRYTQSEHAMQRQFERKVSLSDALYVLKTGYHEKRKTSFDEIFQTWKYAIRGKSLDGVDIRVVITFDVDDMFIITVITC